MQRILQILALACLATIAQADDPDRIRVGVYNNPPKIYTNAEGRAAGFWVDLIDHLSRGRGWKVEYLPCYWDDCLHMLDQGELDVMPDVGFTPERASNFLFSDIPVLNSWSRLFVPLSDHSTYTLLDLDGKRIAGLRNSVNIYGPGGLKEQLARFAIDAEIVEYEEYDQAFSSLERGDVDAAITNRNYADSRAGEFRVRPTPIIFQPVNLHFAFPAGRLLSVSLKQQLDDAMRRLTADADSEYYRLLSRYFETPIAERPVSRLPGWFRQAVLLTLAVVVALFLIAALTGWLVRKRTRALFESELRYREVFNSPLDAIVIARLDDGLVLEVNDSLQAILGYHPEDLVGRRLLDTSQFRGEAGDRVRELMDRLGKGGEVPATEFRMKRRDGKPVWIEVTARCAANLGRDIAIGVIRDVSRRKSYERRLNELAWRDPLTSLPNRALLLDTLHNRIAEAGRTGTKLSVIFLDLDHFKDINDSEGHNFGDRVLCAFSSRLQESLRSYDVLCRFGGDEFVVVSPDIVGPEDSAHLCDKLRDALREPLEVEGREIFVSFSAGIALCPDDGEEAHDLIKKADMAMYQSKKGGRNRYTFYTAAIDETLRRQRELENGLRRALQKSELFLHFQPRVAVESGRITACEALLRWQTAAGDFVPPAEFIPVAEQSSLILEIGEFVLAEACRLRAQLADDVDEAFHVDINLSSQQFSHSPLCDTIERELKAHGLSPRSLGVELTEHTLLEANPATQQCLGRLNRQGTRIALDDFGTGYSALGHLISFPISCIKIDRSFVPHSSRNREQLALLKTIVDMGRNIKREVVVEGVETEEQYRLCRETGCDEVQGYFLYRPMPFEQLQQLLRDRPVYTEADRA